ncbi:MAG: S49 family peptidase, partial [Patescibacteria group bacterium]|nr:S49 family peptidase [Patescibacteria group bacterium]
MLRLSYRNIGVWFCPLFAAFLVAVAVVSTSAAEDADTAVEVEKQEPGNSAEEPSKEVPDSGDSDAKPSEPAATRPSLGQLKERLAQRAKQAAEPAADAEETAKPAVSPKTEKKPAETEEENKDAKAAKESEEAKPEKAKASPKTAPAQQKPTQQKKAEPAKKTVTVADFTLRGAYPEGPAQSGLFGEMQGSLDGIIGRLDAAAEDDAVTAVVLRIEQLGIGRGKLEELRAAVGRIRAADKPVWAVLTSAEPAEYLLASACNRILMPESGMLVVPGVRAEMTFYKGLFDKLGIRFQMLQMGKYKGAAEPYSRTEMSGPLRESLDALIDDTYDLLVQTIATDRNLKDYEVKTLVDVGLFTARAALQAKLVDELVYADQMEERLRRELKADEVKLVANYRKKKVETNFSGLTGMMKLFEMMMGGKPAETTTAAKRIAVIYAVGPITEGKSTSDLFGSASLGSATMVEALRAAADDDKVAAIVLRIDSPGGSAIASDLIWRETIRIEKPIIASMGDVAGSGGYYIAMGADKILAEPGTVTGSIGVIGG